jgi:hypothetical protein
MHIFLKVRAVLAFVCFSLLLSSCGDNSSPTAPVATKPNAPTLSLPANGAVNQSVTAALTWSTVSNATTYHVQVSLTSDFSSLVADSSLSVATVNVLWLIDSTTYYWRVSAGNTIGVSAWSNPSNFTTLKETSFWEFGRSQGYLGYWAAIDHLGVTWLYNFKGNAVVISNVSDVIDTVALTINKDTTETYGGVFSLDSSVTPHAMNIYLTWPTQDKGQMIQTIYNFLPPSGSFEQCNIMLNDPGAARPTDFSNTDKYLPLQYQWTH